MASGGSLRIRRAEERPFWEKPKKPVWWHFPALVAGGVGAIFAIGTGFCLYEGARDIYEVRAVINNSFYSDVLVLSVVSDIVICAVVWNFGASMIVMAGRYANRVAGVLTAAAATGMVGLLSWLIYIEVVRLL